jgi:hypothetical protein
MLRKHQFKQKINFPVNALNLKNKKLKGDHYFKVSIESDVIESHVRCWVLNIATNETATIEFYLSDKNGIKSAAIADLRNDFKKHVWIHDKIDLISPMICRAVLSIE